MNNDDNNPLALSGVDLKNSEQRKRFFKALQEEGTRRAKEAVKKLHALGITDENGNLVRTDLPEDMRPGAKRDFGG
jgi:hypothetical protein